VSGAAMPVKAARVLDGRGGAATLDAAGLQNWTGRDGALWVDMDLNSDSSRTWVRSRAMLEHTVADNLLASETRPRAVATASGLLIVLRGVNLNPGETDGIELEIPTGDIAGLRAQLSDLRRQVASIRRFLAPQRDSLDRLYRQPGAFLTELEAQELREETDRLTRYLEDLDLARERALVTQEELLNRIAQEQNQRMYLLSVVAAIFLPLSFLTGLLGMNVAGLPGTEASYGFAVSAATMIVVGIGLVLIFRWKKWI
jgi:Mg2+ and Co2+ transporter CorA